MTRPPARKFARLALVLSIAAAASHPVAAQEIPGYPTNVTGFDRREVALLPRYCIYTQLFRDAVPGGNDQAVIESWYSSMGKTFHNMHHYCFGLMKTNRARFLSPDERTRRFYLGDAILEYDYVLRTAPEDFVLLPEILTKKAETLVLLGKGPVAVIELERAISAKSDYWPAYAQLSDYYKSIGDTKKALDVLKEGLTQAPDAKGLQRRRSELETGSRPTTKR
jgi:tetratricopeptide (TPR) repeat protein